MLGITSENSLACAIPARFHFSSSRLPTVLLQHCEDAAAFPFPFSCLDLPTSLSEIPSVLSAFFCCDFPPPLLSSYALPQVRFVCCFPNGCPESRMSAYSSRLCVLSPLQVGEEKTQESTAYLPACCTVLTCLSMRAKLASAHPTAWAPFPPSRSGARSRKSQ